MFPAPSWLDSSVGRALQRHRRGHGFESRTFRPEFVSGFIHSCLSCVYNCDGHLCLQKGDLFVSVIDRFRYIKIQPKTIDLGMRLWGITTEFVGVYIP